jgi:hypothetical protein
MNHINSFLPKYKQTISVMQELFGILGDAAAESPLWKQ